MINAIQILRCFQMEKWLSYGWITGQQQQKMEPHFTFRLLKEKMVFNKKSSSASHAVSAAVRTYSSIEKTIYTFYTGELSRTAFATWFTHFLQTGARHLASPSK